MTSRGPVFGSGSAAGAAVRAVTPRRAPRRLAAGLLSVAGGSTGVSADVAAGDSVPGLAVSAGWSCFPEAVGLLPRVGRRLRELRVVVRAVSGLATSADAAGVGSGDGAVATSGSGGSAIRAPVEETRLPFFAARVPGATGCAELLSFSVSGPPAIASNAPP